MSVFNLPQEVLEQIVGTLTVHNVQQAAQSSRMWRRIVCELSASALMRLMKHFSNHGTDYRLIRQLHLVVPGLTIFVCPYQVQKITIHWDLQRPLHYRNTRALGNARVKQHLSLKLRQGRQVLFRIGVQPVDWDSDDEDIDSDEVAADWNDADYLDYIDDAKYLLQDMANHVNLRLRYRTEVYSAM